MVYTKDLKSFGSNVVRVRLPPRPPNKEANPCGWIFCFMREVVEKGGAATAASQGRRDRQQARTGDRLPPRPPVKR